jgi:hypothetical protein
MAAPGFTRHASPCGWIFYACIHVKMIRAAGFVVAPYHGAIDDKERP